MWPAASPFLGLLPADLTLADSEKSADSQSTKKQRKVFGIFLRKAATRIVWECLGYGGSKCKAIHGHSHVQEMG